MKIGFTGNRKGLNEKQKQEILNYFNEQKVIEVHHGDCIGCDSDFHDLISKNFPEINIVIHPPDNDKMRAFKTSDNICKTKTYLKRNHDIVDNSDTLIGCPSGQEIIRSGTWATIRYAKKNNKPTLIYY